MAGSLKHIIDERGRFTMDLIDNLGDAHEALEDCFDIISRMARGDELRESVKPTIERMKSEKGRRYET